jgi:3-methyl-2-oxobutanoate hydroxymethyltransferase
VPTIGIGAGVHCDGQVLVLHDLLGLSEGDTPKFVRSYVDLRAAAVDAVERFAADVRARRFPADEETYHLPAAVAAALVESSLGGPGAATTNGSGAGAGPEDLVASSP